MAAVFLALGAGWLLGLSVAAPLGPTGLESMRRAVRGGFWPGFLVGAGATSIDTLYLLLINLGFGALLAAIQWARRLMWVVGAIVLGYLGVRGLLGGRREPAVAGQPQPAVDEGEGEVAKGAAAGAEGEAGSEAGGEALARPTALHPALAGALITGTNPVTVGLWLAVGATGLASWQARGTALRLLFTAGIIAGLLSWFVILAALAARAGQWLTPARSRRLDQAAGLMLLGFAVYFAVQVWR